MGSRHPPLPPVNEVAKGRYRHYGGDLYEVIGVARHSETLEEMVIYRDLENNTLWARPREMFVGKVEVGSKKVKRFEFIGEK